PGRPRPRAVVHHRRERHLQPARLAVSGLEAEHALGAAEGLFQGELDRLLDIPAPARPERGSAPWPATGGAAEEGLIEVGEGAGLAEQVLEIFGAGRAVLIASAAGCAGEPLPAGRRAARPGRLGPLVLPPARADFVVLFAL